MTERNGQGIFIGVSVAVMCIAGLLFFFPESPEEDAKPEKVSAQVILPRTSSPSRSRPRPRNTNRTARKSPARKPAADPNEIWQVIYLGNKRIGYSRTRFEKLTENGRVRIRATAETQMSFLRFRQRTRMRVLSESLETSNGDLLSFRIRSGSGRSGSQVLGKVEGGRLVFETTIRGKTARRFLPWKRGIKSPMYQDRLVRSSPMKPGEIRRFETFLPDLERFAQVRLAAEGYRNVAGRDGKRRRLLRVRVIQDAVGLVQRDNSDAKAVYVYLDDRGLPVISESEAVGKKLTHYTVSKSEALSAIEGAELDLGISTLLRVPLIRGAHKRKKITYRIYMTDGDPAQYLPAGPTQSVQKINARTVELTVSAAQMPRRRVHVATKREFLNASRFLQSNDPRVREHAQRAAGYDTEPTRVAFQMERYVHTKLANKNFSTVMASAAEVAKHMEGDCTEHAVLLAAMLRARRIPSRIAVGLMYVPQLASFGAHMWTEAWIHGQWIPLDATLGQGGTGPAHIKLADASFADGSAAPVTAFVPLMNVLGRWRIEVRKVE